MQSAVKRILRTMDLLRIHDAIVGRRVSSAALSRAMRVIGLDKKTLAQILSISDATINRRLKSTVSLPKHEAERLYRLARLVDVAARMFGDDEKARSWLIHPAPAFGGYRPVDLLETELSGRDVERVLYNVGYDDVA